eukprot:12672417-Ditylum_brightwellii.AAC.1
MEEKKKGSGEGVNVIRAESNGSVVECCPQSPIQGSRHFASDSIIHGFDTPAKIVLKDGIQFQNFNYAGIVTKMLQPILPIFFAIQFNFLYEGMEK